MSDEQKPGSDRTTHAPREHEASSLIDRRRFFRGAAALTIGGPINFMTKAEAITSSDAMLRASARPWALWRKKVMREL